MLHICILTTAKMNHRSPYYHAQKDLSLFIYSVLHDHHITNSILLTLFYLFNDYVHRHVIYLIISVHFSVTTSLEAVSY